MHTILRTQQASILNIPVINYMTSSRDYFENFKISTLACFYINELCVLYYAI